MKLLMLMTNIRSVENDNEIGYWVVERPLSKKKNKHQIKKQTRYQDIKSFKFTWHESELAIYQL